MSVVQFEQKVTEALLAGSDPVLEVLRAQYAAASVGHREFSGVGFLTYCDIPANLPRVELRHFAIDDVHLKVAGVETGAGAILFIRDGAIDFLECVTYTEAWPEDPVLLSLSYSRRKPRSTTEFVLSDERDLDFVRRKWES